jgi:hypothetical protein
MIYTLSRSCFVLNLRLMRARRREAPLDNRALIPRYGILPRSLVPLDYFCAVVTLRTASLVPTATGIVNQDGAIIASRGLPAARGHLLLTLERLDVNDP